MTIQNADPTPEQPPSWALDQAADELYGESDREVLTARAHEIARAAQQRTDERHDEYDDPDQGGEA